MDWGKQRRDTEWWRKLSITAGESEPRDAFKSEMMKKIYGDEAEKVGKLGDGDCGQL